MNKFLIILISSLLLAMEGYSQVFEFRYKNNALEENAEVVIMAEEDKWGSGELNCETNPSAAPKEGLILTILDGSEKAGKATIEIVSNTLDAQRIQWCMGGECTLMRDKTYMEKSFTTGNDGVCQVQFDVMNMKSEGSLEANLTATIEGKTHKVKILCVYSANSINPTIRDLPDKEIYDLNGRKIQTPTYKGIYVKDGRKVVISQLSYH